MEKGSWLDYYFPHIGLLLSRGLRAQTPVPAVLSDEKSNLFATKRVRIGDIRRSPARQTLLLSLRAFPLVQIDAIMLSWPLQADEEGACRHEELQCDSGACDPRDGNANRCAPPI